MKMKTKMTEYTLKYTITSSDPRVINDAHGILSELKPSKKYDRLLVQREFTESEAIVRIIYETRSRFNVRFAKMALDIIYKTLKYKYGS